MDPERRTGILFSCSLNSYQDVEQQIKLGCDIHERDDFGVPAIIVAARKNNTRIVKLLIDAKVDPHTVSPAGETIAYWAHQHNNHIMRKLIGLD